MANKQEEKLKALLKYQQENENLRFRQWFLKQFEARSSNAICTLEEFAVYFLNTLRQHTEVHLKTTNGTETPKCQTPVRNVKATSMRDETATSRRLLLDSTQHEASTPNDNISSKKDQFNTSYNDFASNSNHRLSTSVDRSGYSQKNTTSTPVRRNISGNSRRLSTTPVSTNKSATSSFCLGDFLVTNASSHNRSHKKKSSQHTPNQQQNAGQQNKTPTEKPKKRLQPISISKKVESTANNSSIFAGESSFSNDNNILKISHTELEDKEQCAILAARKTLRLNASEITKEIADVSMASTSLNVDNIATSTPSKDIKIEEQPLDLKNLENCVILKRIAEIYAILIDLNLTTNILNEFSFLLNLLNAPNANSMLTEACNSTKGTDKTEGLECLEDLSHAVYFAIDCLTLQKQSLASLDTKSLSVVLISERYAYLPVEVKSFLLDVYQRKQHLVAERPFHDTSICFDTKPCNNVYFQEDQDSRQNFTSHQEFANFRAQRDLFCKCLKIWESSHLNPMWKFSSEITPKIKEIFQYSENCINMAHFAKLFVSQLLLSASNTASPEEMGLDVDLQKFTKLTQRLIAPSQFSVDYQFPRAQAFFRDFIVEARSLAFAEQLKIELYTELISLNDSSFDQISISKTENDPEEQNPSFILASYNQHVIVRPEILNSMIILAKFLGFTSSLPFNLNGSNTVPIQVEKKQIRLRTLMQPTFNICVIVQDGIEQGKLLITIPWLVQYFAMLDNITLQLETYMKALKVMFALYWYMGAEDATTPLHNTSIFIVRLCLGWLFESKQFIAEQYYNFRALFNENSPELADVLKFVKTKLYQNPEESCVKSEYLELNPLLESILPVACPFLAEFRVSIMPAKHAYAKNASRTGRYRHITTRIAELSTTPQIKEDEPSQNSSSNKPKQTQNNLIQAFLQSQNSSTRHIINFCTERCYKSVVKDGQLKILLPGKASADRLVNKITSFDYRIVYKEVKTIYEDAQGMAVDKWNDSIPGMLDERIRNALDSLLPEETSSILKKTYFMIIKKDTTHKISQWFYSNMIKECYFCSNLQEMANKICSANKSKVQLGSSDLTITKGEPSVSDLIDDLQYWLHSTSVRDDLFKDSKPIVHLLKSLLTAFDNILPSIFYRLMAAGIIQLLQHIIAIHNTHHTMELIDAACQVWLHPNMQEALNLSKPSKDQEKSSSSSSGCIYDALITIAFIESLGTKTNCYNELGRLIVVMIQKHVISLNYTNQLFLTIFKHEWHPFVLKEISNMLRFIAKETTSVVNHKSRYNSDDSEYPAEENDEKSILFMDMLADLSRDVDFD